MHFMTRIMLGARDTKIYMSSFLQSSQSMGGDKHATNTLVLCENCRSGSIYQSRGSTDKQVIYAPRMVVMVEVCK